LFHFVYKPQRVLPLLPFLMFIVARMAFAFGALPWMRSTTVGRAVRINGHDPEAIAAAIRLGKNLRPPELCD
jgi:hypothetical protein